MERVDLDPPLKGTRWSVPTLFVLFGVFPLFMHLDTLPIRVWDEARQAINAMEMWENRDFLVTHFEGDPEMWSTKPPLLIWAQVAFFSLLGPGELALRLPSAIAAFLTGWFLLRLCTRELNAPWMGLMACLVLYTNEGYINMHVARGGEYDAPMILWMTTSAWALFRWSLHGRSTDLLWCMLLLALGVLTKSVQALLFVPGMALYLLYRGQLLQMLRQRVFWTGCALFTVLVGGFYMAREAVNPGYLQAVWDNELGGRYASVLSGHDHPWDHYIRSLIDSHFSHWWLLAPMGVVLGLATRDERLRHWTVLLSGTAVTYLCVISTAQTKLIWYEAPLIVLLAGLAAIPLHLAFEWACTERWSPGRLRSRVLPYLLLFGVFVTPYSSTIARVYFPKEEPWEEAFYALSHHLQKATKGHVRLDADVLVHEQYNAHLMFYVRLLNRHGHPLQRSAKEDLRPGMVVLTDEGFVQEAIEGMYRFDIDQGEWNIRTYRILGLCPEDEGP